MVQYPVIIKSSSTGNSDTQETWSSIAGSFGPLEISIPHEFDGPNTSYSPEDLFAMALVNCYMATFKVIAKRSHLNYETIAGNCIITLDRDSGDHGTVRIVEAAFEFKVSGVSEESKALRLMDQVSRSCILINSIRAKTSFQFDIADAKKGAKQKDLIN